MIAQPAIETFRKESLGPGGAAFEESREPLASTGGMARPKGRTSFFGTAVGSGGRGLSDFPAERAELWTLSSAAGDFTPPRNASVGFGLADGRAISS